MTKKQLLVIGVGIVIILAVIAGIFLYPHPTKPQEVKIGAILPLTGDIAVYGEKMKNGIDLAVQEINNKGGVQGRNITVIYEDDMADAKTSVSAFQNLNSIQKVPVVIGGGISSTALATAPLADKYSIVLFSPSATSPKLTGISKYFFRNWPSDTYEGTTMGQYAADQLQLRNVSVLYVNNDWGVGLSQEFEKSFNEKGGKIVAEEAFAPGATDFRTQLTKIKGSNPQAIYIIGYLKEILVLLKQKEELGIKTQILGSYSFYDPQIPQEIGSGSEGIIFTAPIFTPESSSGIVKSYVNAYKSKYGVEPDIWSAQAYDAMNIITLALKNGANTGPEIRDEIAKVKNYDGVSGLTSFDKNGEVIKPLRFMTIKNGTFVDYISDV